MLMKNSGFKTFEIREVLNVQFCSGSNEYKMLEFEGLVKSNA